MILLSLFGKTIKICYIKRNDFCKGNLMRILAGRLKGRVIELKGKANFRPALALVRKSLFDILRFQISSEQRFLDLFGGSGCVGIEAYSRGIDNVWINELDNGNFSSINGNLKHFGVESHFKVFNKDFRVMLENIRDEKTPFDYIFAAPPYKDVEFYGNVVTFFDQNRHLLSKNGYLILEYRRKTEIDVKGFDVARTNTYGDTMVMMLKKSGD